MSARVLIIDSDPLRRAGLATLISQHDDLNVVGTGCDLIDATCVRLCNNLPNIGALISRYVVLDHNRRRIVEAENEGDLECNNACPISADMVIISIDAMVDIRSWAVLRLLFPNVDVIGYTMNPTGFPLLSAVASNIGFLIGPTIKIDGLASTIGNLSWERGYIDPGLSTHLVESIVKGISNDEGFSKQPDLPISSTASEKKIELLTPREKEVLEKLVIGLSNRMIGESLGICHSTVSYHVSNIISKLGVSSRVEAAIVGDHMLSGRAISPSVEP